MLTTSQVAERYGVTRWQVTRWISTGLLAATKYGRDWLIDEAALETFQRPRKTGRPRKGKPGA